MAQSVGCPPLAKVRAPDPPSMGPWKSKALWVHTGLRPMVLARQWREGMWLERKTHKKV